MGKRPLNVVGPSEGENSTEVGCPGIVLDGYSEVRVVSREPSDSELRTPVEIGTGELPEGVMPEVVKVAGLKELSTELWLTL
jgi:hypothetical protein